MTMAVLEREHGLRVAPAVALPEVDEAAARRDLRDQIAKLEAQLGAAVSAGFPHLVAPSAGRPAAAGRLLDLGALEGVRDELADRLRALRRKAEALGARQAASRRLLERMRLEPGRYRWVRVHAADLGEPGCQSWQVRPRMGVLGMLMGWWRVKLSSGCPLATAGAAGSPAVCRPGVVCPRRGRTATSDQGGRMPPRGVKKGTKRARQYEHIKESERRQGRSEPRAEEIAARTVNKERARAGESRQRSRTSVRDISSSRRGGKRSGTSGPRGRTRDQLYNEAKQKGIEGRSKMTKAQLQRAVAGKS
jgi:hypothetical protein